MPRSRGRVTRPAAPYGMAGLPVRETPPARR